MPGAPFPDFPLNLRNARAFFLASMRAMIACTSPKSPSPSEEEEEGVGLGGALLGALPPFFCGFLPFPAMLAV